MNDNVILACEDTTLVRYSNLDAGPLMSGFDTGYVTHYAVAVAPGTGIPLGWMGAIVLNRADTPHRNHNHQSRPMNERESIKWSLVRDCVHENAKNIGFEGLIISLNDSEGDAWSSLTDAVEKDRKIIVRSCQNRKLENSNVKLREFVHKKPSKAKMTFTTYTKLKSGKVSHRKAFTDIRWEKVILAPPKDFFAKKTPLPFYAIEVFEKNPPKKRKDLKVTCLQTAK